MKKYISGLLSNTVLSQLPNQDDLNNFHFIKVLSSPPSCKEVLHDQDTTKEKFFDKHFVEISYRCEIKHTKRLDIMNSDNKSNMY